MILDSNEIMFRSFEPKTPNKFVVYMDGMPSYLIKSMSAIDFEDGEITLHHINNYRKVRSGKRMWGDVTFKIFDPIAPSGAQALMEWARLGYESVTGRAGYSDMYKKDVVFRCLGPVGDIVSEWILKGAFIKSADFGEYSWENYEEAVEIEFTCAIDYAILNF